MEMNGLSAVQFFLNNQFNTSFKEGGSLMLAMYP